MLKEDEQFDIVFLHTDGKEHSLSAGINKLNGSWMYWWDDGVEMYAADKPMVNEVVKNIREKSQGVLLDTFSK
jgi:hypothetical protein